MLQWSWICVKLLYGSTWVACQHNMGNKAPKLPKGDLKMLTEKTNFTEKQIKQWHKGFMVRLIYFGMKVIV